MSNTTEAKVRHYIQLVQFNNTGLKKSHGSSLCISAYEIKLKSIGVNYVTFDTEIFYIFVVFTDISFFGMALEYLPSFNYVGVFLATTLDSPSGNMPSPSCQFAGRNIANLP